MFAVSNIYVEILQLPFYSPFTTLPIKCESLRPVRKNRAIGRSSDISSQVIFGGCDVSRKHLPLIQARGALALVLYLIKPSISQTHRKVNLSRNAWLWLPLSFRTWHLSLTRNSKHLPW